MIKLVVGLGNPGRQYEKTRHNAGFLFLDSLTDYLGLVWVNESRFSGLLAEAVFAGRKLMLLKPATFMNRSGVAVGNLVRYYNLAPEEILVVHDELDFEVGVAKLKKNGGHAGHNGLRDIISHLGSNEFYRLRIGVGRPLSRMDVAGYVLSVPTKEERDKMHSVFQLAGRYIEPLVKGDLPKVMNDLNSGK